MPTGTLSRLEMAAQDRPATSAAEAAATLEPLITGADTALWVGFGAFVAIFLIVLVSIIRTRVIKPAQRMTHATDFFEPAGAGAEITFDDPAHLQIKELKKARKKKRAEKAGARSGLDHDEPTEIAPDDDAANEEKTEPAEETVSKTDPQMAEIAAAIDDAAAAEDTEEKQPGPFADLFDRDNDTQDDQQTPQDDGDEAFVLAEAPADVRIDHLPEVDDDYWQADQRHREADAEYERAAEERRLALEEAAKARADADAAHHRLETEREEASARLSATERQAAEAAHEHRLQAMSEMQGKLDAMADRLARDADTVEGRISASVEKKFACLREELQGRLNAFGDDVEAAKQNAEAAQPRGGDHEGALAITRHLGALQKTTEAALTALAERIDALSAAQPTAATGATPDAMQRLSAALAQRAAPAVAGALQLSDLVRSALPAGRFSIDHTLSNGANADCLITRRGGDIAIDAGYPAEAFDRYARADEAARDHAATAYRRAVLRHMIFVAEKLIAPEETADFAILFVPNDTIFNDLHQNFADIVQDSYRARIWIASPTSLMATLHMMNAAGRPETEQQSNNNAELHEAVSTLTARIGALEENIAELKNRPVPSPSASEQHTETAPVETPLESQDATVKNLAPFSENDEADVEIIGTSASATENVADEDKDDADDRPPFPLR